MLLFYQKSSNLTGFGMLNPSPVPYPSPAYFVEAGDCREPRSQRESREAMLYYEELVL
ncbi:MAG: hypothetical protein RIM23_24460 [Coleofasciculus sp. G3-WIS-01]